MGCTKKRTARTCLILISPHCAKFFLQARSKLISPMIRFFMWILICLSLSPLFLLIKQLQIFSLPFINITTIRTLVFFIYGMSKNSTHLLITKCWCKVFLTPTLSYYYLRKFFCFLNDILLTFIGHSFIFIQFHNIPFLLACIMFKVKRTLVSGLNLQTCEYQLATGNATACVCTNLDFLLVFHFLSGKTKC